jgi:hypothetical protein
VYRSSPDRGKRCGPSGKEGEKGGVQDVERGGTGAVVGGIDEVGEGRKEVGREMGEGEMDVRGKQKAWERKVWGRMRWTRWRRRESLEGERCGRTDGVIGWEGGNGGGGLGEGGEVWWTEKTLEGEKLWEWIR